MSFTFPGELPGWLTEEEGRALYRLASGKDVLEIGSFMGRSSVCLAQGAKSLTCVDTFDGRATNHQIDTYEACRENLKAYGVLGKTKLIRGESRDIVPYLDQKFDLVFIDGDHDYSLVSLDAKIARAKLKPGGLLAFHDYNRPPGQPGAEPGVTDTVNELIERGHSLVDIVDSIAILDPSGETCSKPYVAITCPSRKKWPGPPAEIFNASRGKCNILPIAVASSLLNHCFNQCWAQALNARELGVTHLAMVHDDILPERGWLDILMGELTRLDADVVSAVVPIKDERGITSTAVEGDSIWEPRRLTMHEVFQLPETFSAEDAGAPLLLNTGLWLCDLRKPWCEFASFDSLEKIVRLANGKFHALVVPEDWLFSHELNRRGARLFATRKVKLSHIGDFEFRNDSVWGTWTSDESAEERDNAKRRATGTDRTGEVLRDGNDQGSEPSDLPEGCGVRTPAVVG